MEAQSLLFQPSPATLADAIKKRDAAMDQVEEHAGEDWQDYAISIIRDIARTRDTFTSDEVMEALKWEPHDPRALGPAMKRAQRAGIIAPTDDFKLSRRRHATPIRVWRIGVCA